jgi:PhzF family phenazine biosynthesis protein
MKTYFVDSFTSEKFKGNPAAVCIVENDLDAMTMQSIATEIGFSETAFIKKNTGNNYKIRFFTPKMEISLCGHATLAASKIIFGTAGLQNIIFLNIENLELKIEISGNEIVMEFPVYDTIKINVPKSLLDAIGIDETVDTRYNPKRKRSF